MRPSDLLLHEDPTLKFLGTSISAPSIFPPTDAFEHEPFLMWLIARAKPAHVAELGTFDGASYLAMCEAVETAGIAAKCTAIGDWGDASDAAPPAADAFARLAGENARYKEFSRLLNAPCVPPPPGIEDASLDILALRTRQIDRDVAAVFAAWKPKLSPRAVVLLHGIGAPGDSGGPALFWQDIRRDYPSWHLDRAPGLGVLFAGRDLPAEMQDLADLVQDDRTRDIAAQVFDAASEKLAAERAQSALARRLDSTLADMRRARAEMQTRLKDLKTAFAEREKQVSDLRDMAEKSVRILRRPMRSSLVTRLARGAAKLPGLSQRRREKFLRSARKRDPQDAADRLSEALRTLDADLPSFSWAPARFWGADPDSTRLELREHSQDVDIVVCVHNALDDVRACLSSIIAKTIPPYRLIIVDDGSASETRQYLEEFARSQSATLLRNDVAGGYTNAANRGLQASTAPWTILLNSDVIVPFGWLDEMLKIAGSDPMIGIVGPSSNTASWQSVPRLLLDNGDWADNPLDDGVTVDDMQNILASLAPPQGIDLPFLNGFAFLIRREVIDDIGIFDSETFGAGYGEENDYCIRARDAGWKLLFAPNAYVFHAQSKSYSTERRLKLARAADENLRRKHDEDTKILPQVTACRWNLATESLRARVAVHLEDRDRIAAFARKYAGTRLAFVLPARTAGGGSNIVVQEASLLSDLGVDTWIINLSANRHDFERTYGDARATTLYFENPHEISDYLARNPLGFDAVVATVHFSVDWLPDSFSGRRPTLGYYIQDFEPNFYRKTDKRYAAALATYDRLTDITGFTKTAWNARKVAETGAPAPRVIGASVDLERFRPKGRDVAPRSRLVVVAMIRFDGQVGRRAPELTLRVLNRLARTYGDRVDIHVFGCDDVARMQQLIEEDMTDQGILAPAEVASLFRNADIFLDFSTWQAMGLSAMEAMACGCAVVVPQNGGTVEFCRHEENALVIDTGEPEACFAAASRLVEDHELRNLLRRNATADICAFTQERSAMRMVEVLLGEEN